MTVTFCMGLRREYMALVINECALKDENSYVHLCIVFPMRIETYTPGKRQPNP